MYLYTMRAWYRQPSVNTKKIPLKYQVAVQLHIEEESDPDGLNCMTTTV